MKAIDDHLKGHPGPFSWRMPDASYAETKVRTLTHAHSHTHLRTHSRTFARATLTLFAMPYSASGQNDAFYHYAALLSRYSPHCTWHVQRRGLIHACGVHIRSYLHVAVCMQVQAFLRGPDQTRVFKDKIIVKSLLGRRLRIFSCTVKATKDAATVTKVCFGYYSELQCHIQHLSVLCAMCHCATVPHVERHMYVLSQVHDLSGVSPCPVCLACRQEPGMTMHWTRTRPTPRPTARSSRGSSQ